MTSRIVCFRSGRIQFLPHTVCNRACVDHLFYRWDRNGFWRFGRLGSLWRIAANRDICPRLPVEMQEADRLSPEGPEPAHLFNDSHTRFVTGRVSTSMTGAGLGAEGFTISG